MSPWGERSVPRHVRKRIHERDGGLCQLGLPGCTVYSEAVDHIVPISVTGLSREYDDDDNLRAVCNHCHHIVTEQHRIARVKEAAAHRYARRHLPVKPHPGE